MPHGGGGAALVGKKNASSHLAQAPRGGNSPAGTPQKDEERGDGVCMAGYNEKRLLHDLLDSYNILERPVVNESDPLQLSFGLTLMQIIDVDEKNQLLVTNIWLKLAGCQAGIPTGNGLVFNFPTIGLSRLNSSPQLSSFGTGPSANV
uniref:Neurotransmitter-gated ion-channel ligand-binding domain-containing protein n=1 Tax=Anopheles farauti TaxID=69004 RepID=A0A182Q493_9DIPT